MMHFREWRSWLASFPWSLQWFIYLLLFRPVLDLMYFLKEISPFLSPAYLVGVISPLIALYALATTRKPAKTAIDRAWIVWGIPACLSAVFILENEPSLDGFGAAFKVILPIYIYFVLRRLIKSKRDLQGYLQTFIYSLVVPAGIFLYEVFVAPIQQVQSSRDLERISGGYADVTSYGFYLTLGLVVAGYFFFVAQSRDVPARNKLPTNSLLLFVIVLGGFVLIKINHAASFATFAALILLIILFGLRKANLLSLLGLFALLFSLYFIIGETVEANITRIIATDIEVLQGERLPEQAFHGRMSTWSEHLTFFAGTPVYARALGLPYLGIDDIIQYVLVGPHSDYLRIMYSTGIIGLVLYLFATSMVIIKGRLLPKNERFLLFGMLAVVLLYSLTTTPTIYYVVMPLSMAVFAYVSMATSIRPPGKHLRAYP